MQTISALPLEGECDTVSDEASQVQAAQQDPAAFAPLCHRYQDRVYMYLRTRTGSDDDAADLTQQVFLRALDSLSLQDRGRVHAGRCLRTCRAAGYPLGSRWNGQSLVHHKLLEVGAMAVDTEELVRNVTRLLPPYRVMLHNDDYNTMDHVVRALVQSVPKLSVREAGRIMLEAHLRGVAQVIVCPKEQAELYCERLTSFGLTATMEPAG